LFSVKRIEYQNKGSWFGEWWKILLIWFFHEMLMFDGKRNTLMQHIRAEYFKFYECFLPNGFTNKKIHLSNQKNFSRITCIMLSFSLSMEMEYLIVYWNILGTRQHFHQLFKYKYD
jgi:hypothetical protein